MHVWTCVCGNTAVIASGKPFRPSTTATRTFSTPRFFSSFMTRAQPEFRAFGLLDPQAKDFLGSVGPNPGPRNGFIAHHAFVAHLDQNGVEENQRVKRSKRPVLPFGGENRFSAIAFPASGAAVLLAFIEMMIDLGVQGSWRWTDYSGMPEDEERDHIRQTVATIRDICGAPPLGWYTGRYSPNTRRLVMEETETLYNSDAYNDDLPYWVHVAGKPRLIVPYALDTNDFKSAMSPGWMSGEDFFTYLKAAFDQLHREGEREPKMMSIGLHGRLIGRLGRADALARFMDYVQGHKTAWVCRWVEIARHWMQAHPSTSGRQRAEE